MQNFIFLFNFVLLLRPLLLKAQFNLVPADVLKNHGVHPVLLGRWAELPGFFHISVQINVSSTINMQKKGFYKEFALQRSFVVILWINEVGGTCKMNIEMALKSSRYILDLDRVKLSLEIYFSELFNGEFFLLAFRICLYCCQKHTPKSCKFNVLPNFTCGKGSLDVPWSAM